MATYKKRGYKPKNKEEREAAVEEQSSTAGVFNNLDEGASRTEEWVAKNQKPIFIIIGIVVIAVLGYLGYERFVNKPKQHEAAGEMAQSQQYFQSALDASGSQKDSLYILSLNGNGGKYGFLDIIENYGGTDAANLSHYYAGMAFLNTGKYKQAIDELQSFSSDDEILAPLAKGAIGDAFMNNGQPGEAVDYYEKAASMRDNDFTTPKFLRKAGIAALKAKDASEAEKYFTKLKDNYPDAPEAKNLEVFIGKAKAMQ